MTPLSVLTGAMGFNTVGSGRPLALAPNKLLAAIRTTDIAARNFFFIRRFLMLRIADTKNS
jgi:hypothetical protein